MSLCDLDLTFDLAVVTLNLKSCPGYISETVKCRKLIIINLVGTLVMGVVGAQHHGVILI